MDETLLSIEYVPVGDVVPAVRNPKAHDLDELRRSVARFGYVEPVMRDERTGRLIAGHGRTETLSSLAAAAADADEHIDPPRGVRIDEEGRWLIPVVVGWESRDDAEADAYVIAANRLTERGGWHTTQLVEMLGELDAEVGLLGIGYAPADLDRLLAEVTYPELGGGGTDPEKAWTGMPEFNSENRKPAFVTHLHFPTVEDAQRFFKEVLGQDRPAKNTWWPAHDGFQGMDSSWAWGAEGDGAAEQEPVEA